MSSVNKVILVGRLGQDPETRHFQDGNSVTNASLATSEKWNDKTTGEKKEATEWHNISFNGRLSDIASTYLKKGSLIYVEGKLKTRKWQDKEGNDKYITDIQVLSMQMIGEKTQSNTSDRPQLANYQKNNNNNNNQKTQNNPNNVFIDDIPF